MRNHNWKKEIITIPNLLSVFRLLLIPVYTGIYLTAKEDLDYYLAGSLLTLSCLTDIADGKIARHYHMISDLGKVLDPLADKLTQFALILSLSRRHSVLLPLLLLFLLKELFQLTVMIIFMGRGKVLSGALFEGKLCTAVLFSSLILLVLFPALNEAAVKALILIDSIFLAYAFRGYFLAYFIDRKHLTDWNRE